MTENLKVSGVDVSLGVYLQVTAVVIAVDYSMARLGVVLRAGGACFCDTGRLRGAEAVAAQA
jgi:hypothetical protein